MATEGRVDGVKAGFLLGWVHDPERPGDRIELDVRLDGELVGRCIADIPRGDLIRESVGDGHHAFRVKLPEPLEPGSEHVVVVRTSGEGRLVPLAENYLADPTGGADGAPLILMTESDETSQAQAGEAGVEADAAQANGSPAKREAPTWLPPKPSVPRALLGSGGWLFPYDGPERMARLLGARPAPRNKAAAQTRMLQARHKRLSELGVNYLVATMPSKAAVYAEHLPPGLTLEQDGRPADQLCSALRDEPSLEVLDLLAVLRHARHHGRVFLRQGEQLTWMGAAQAARALIKELAKRVPEIEPPSSGSVELGTSVESSDQLRWRERVTILGGELVPIAAIDDTSDLDPELRHDQLAGMYVPLPPELEGVLGSGAALLEHTSPSGLPRAVVLHDGCAERLVPFLADHFARTLVDVTEGVPYPVIEQEHPLVVIQIISEDSSFFA